MIATLGEEHAAKGVSARGGRYGFRRECDVGRDSIRRIVTAGAQRARPEERSVCRNDCDSELARSDVLACAHSRPFLQAVKRETVREEPPSTRIAWRSVPRRKTRGRVFEIPRPGKLKLGFADRARQNFHGVVCAVEGERMDRVGAGDAKMNRNSGGNQNAVRNEQVLLRDHAHGDRAIRLLLGSQIILHELSR